nr:MAG TPA: hypothetical protein [Caudoviricetes sp.]
MRLTYLGNSFLQMLVTHPTSYTGGPYFYYTTKLGLCQAILSFDIVRISSV